ncbi:hypothetical protein B7755_049405 [Streptomyces sp. NBS 14/10]|uniref:hypothetical protein n=1 Tax=Streptomyces sp. NBS 14/10 TaxID=1945643 RepID=UPI00117C0749|nr:hypothetical protein [Streptomyces sp. NBS 14/10]KAK1185402.1 hypothetical protein B7755_049405 [Streptomyces sp. NBS 14/10]NUP40173.1 hypothetical protein [Streptomyces sp.]NUS84296.1 hypothetical protein [Streptomyces sp.]
MQGARDVDIERILAMVDASAAVVAPEDREDLFSEFAEDMRESGRIPGEDSALADDADAGIADTHVFLGIGLTLLGQIAVKVVSVATDMAVERGIREALTFVVKLFRGSEPGEDSPDDVADAVTRQLAVPAELDEETLRLIVRSQLEAWARAEGQPVDPA